ncbi:hypothetical protein [Aggregatilinea lenta]|uniref:hypothetical protein n=1 Tax=Aggregatilinea lenta TaxID=913108 RepID=UPI000E5BA8F8|nr:hypothetical protein [Aggregatilinea lenta]
MEIIDAFEQTVNNIFAVYFDATQGFSTLRRHYEERLDEDLKFLKSNHPDLVDTDYLNSGFMSVGIVNVNAPDASYVYQCTSKEYIERNSMQGINSRFIGNMALVTLYQYWEDYYRAEIASELGIEKNALKYPIMGDLRYIRRSIIHHSGIALKDIEQCELLTWYKEGDSIFIDLSKFTDVIYHVKIMINDLRNRTCL